MDINWPNGDIYNRTRPLLTIVFMTRRQPYLIPFMFAPFHLPVDLYCLAISYPVLSAAARSTFPLQSFKEVLLHISL